MAGFGIVAMFVSSFVIVLLGEWMIDIFKLPTFKGIFGFNQRMGRLASVILYGSIPVYGILIGITIPTIPVVIGVVIYTALLAILSVTAAGLLKLKI